MHAKHNFPEGDCLCMPLNIKIAVIDGNSIFPKVTANVCPWKLVKELMDAEY